MSYLIEGNGAPIIGSTTFSEPDIRIERYKKFI